MHTQKVDIAIVGAGIVGCMLANLLTKNLPHIKVALVDKQIPVGFDTANDIGLRVYAINHAAQHLFESLDLWPLIKRQRSCAYQYMTVWEDNMAQSLSFDADDIGQAELGYIIEHDLLHSALFDLVEKNQNSRLYCPATVQYLDVQSNTANVELDNGQLLQATLLIAADGADSVLRNMSNINVTTSSYLQSAIVAVVATEKHHQYTAWQRFLNTGPLAFLPLDDGRSSIVWSLPAEQAQMLLTCDESEFIDLLAQHSQHCLGNIIGVGKRAKFALQHMHANNYVQPRLALIGDAAHVVHPLAGQGLNLGLNDVSVLVKILIAAYEQRVDIGQLHILKRYERRCQLHNRLMSEMFGGLNSLYSSQHPILKAVRSSGLAIVNKTDWLKRFFMQQAIGRI